MKKSIWALVLALALMMTGVSLGEAQTDAAEDSRTALMSVDDVKLYLEDVQNMAEILYMYGYIEEGDMLTPLEYLLYYQVAPLVLVGDRAEEYLGEPYAEMAELYGEEFDGYIDEYALAISGLTPGEEGYDEACMLALEAYAAEGYTRDSYIRESLSSMAYSVLVDGFGCEVTDEEIRSEYDTMVESDRQMVEDNPMLYEYYGYYGYTLYYRPEGYRGVLHILLETDEALTNAYVSAETDEERAAAGEAMIADVQDTLDAIYAGLAEGTEFEALIAQYNTDPGMQDPETLKTGYEVHAQSILYAQEFTDGAFSEGMDAPGCVSKPVPSQFGVHVIYYLRDIPGGAVEMTDDIREEIYSTLLTGKQMDQVIGLMKAHEITYTDAYAQYIGQPNFLDD